MLLRLDTIPTIENLNHHAEAIVQRLASLLQYGAFAEPDPRRKGFYDVSDGTRVFFIHISPVSGKVLLLASWESVPAARPAARRAFAGAYDCSACPA